jgi:hypothetical protein
MMGIAPAGPLPEGVARIMRKKELRTAAKRRRKRYNHHSQNLAKKNRKKS